MKILLSLLFMTSSFFMQTAEASMSESAFSTLLNIIQKNYPDIEIQGSWDNETVNAQAMRFDESKLVVIYGGLAHERTTTVDSFTLMVCHEIGHHLGEKPYFPAVGAAPWVTGEGAADYYSVQSCFNKLAPTIAEQKVTLPQNYESDIRKICSSQTEFAICRRALIAGIIVAKLQWQVLPYETAEPHLSNKDPEKVKSVLLEYGSPQCRLDTFVASAIAAPRPQCWFPRH
ncbi:hypothetical protein B9G69_010460 [Bdellovibrio sp. SKB1291214]|uniref:hypothetical protein n=1 Tax=Bdellovibrio sp. SKB1291214 TaxID=1732569 RepID=UPI001130A5F2|nr:hypothetical protein [Bdellovibrio sp. SKB1291214]UYL07466.1 hypothetical protein B9G69_010460 [Bdellovibrio sp. SKB1291214]